MSRNILHIFGNKIETPNLMGLESACVSRSRFSALRRAHFPRFVTGAWIWLQSTLTTAGTRSPTHQEHVLLRCGITGSPEIVLHGLGGGVGRGPGVGSDLGVGVGLPLAVGDGAGVTVPVAVAVVAAVGVGRGGRVGRGENVGSGRSVAVGKGVNVGVGVGVAVPIGDTRT